MSVSLNMNQFAQTPIKGNIAAIVNPVTISCQIDTGSSASASAPILAGDAVRLTNATGNTIVVDSCANTLAPFGYVIYSPKKDKFVAGDPIEVALAGSVIYLESNGAIARGKLLEWVLATHQVKVWAGANATSGLALDKASGTGVLLRVQVLQPKDTEFSSSSSSRSSSSSSKSSSSSSSSSAA